MAYCVMDLEKLQFSNCFVNTVLIRVPVFDHVFLMSHTQLEKKWERKLEEAMKDKQKVKASETQDDSSQTDAPDSVTELLSLDQLEDRLSAQRMVLQRESDSKLSKAVEEAVRGKEGELEEKHAQDMKLQVCFTQHLCQYLRLFLVRQKSKLLV